MRSICYIPSIDCLVYRSTEYWLGQFAQRSGMPATDVVFPAIVEAEPAYPSRYGQTAARLGQFNWLGQWVQDARHQHPQLRVWAAINPTISSLSNGMIATRDQWNEPMSDTCINHVVVQQMLTQIINELADLQVDGITFDLTDLYPNSTSSRYPKLDQGEQLIQNSCFCTYCIDKFAEISQFQLDPEHFRGKRNITRHILRASDQGATFIELRDSWMDSLDVDSLVRFSAARGFIERDDPHREDDGRQLLRYANARAAVTADAIARLRQTAYHRGLRTAVVLGTAQFDISSGTSMAALVNRSASDEYWSSDAETRVNIREHPLVIFNERRATYAYNALFANLRTLEDPREYSNEADRIGHVISITGAAIEHSPFSSSSCAVLQIIPNIAGIAGIPYTMQDFIEWIRQRHTDRQFPQRRMMLILSHVRNPAPDERRGGAAGRDPFA